MSTISPAPEADPGNKGIKPSGPWQPPTVEELQALLPQYEISAMLGRGGMGAVYQGRQISLDRPVAIKILSAELDDSDLGFAERFKNEARAMGKLSHPGIVAVHDFGETPDGLLYIVMEFIEGTDVQQMIAASKRLHTEHAMAIACHVCDALGYAHERGIIHRDIKPANIMVGYDGSVKVADFGLAKMTQSNATGLTQSGMAMGTMHYMAPEALLLGSSVDHRADIYAVGVMLYHMLTGKVPQGMFEMPSMQVPGLDPRFDAIIARALRENRDLRHQTTAELRQDLDQILTRPVVKAEVMEEGTAPPAAAALLPTQARPQRPGGRQPYRPAQAPAQAQTAKKSSGAWLVWAVLGVLVLGGGYGWFNHNGKDEQKITQVPQQPATNPSAQGGPPSSEAKPSPTSTPPPSTTLPPTVPAPALITTGPKTLEEALLNYTWEWTHAPLPPDQLTFHPDGTATCPRFSNRWKVTGPRTVFASEAVQKGKPLPNWSAILQFDDTFTLLTTAKTDGSKLPYTGRRMGAINGAVKIVATDGAPTIASPGKAADEVGLVPLFNGSDLTGWASDTRFWSVRDGVITGESPSAGGVPETTFLIWQGGDVGDFELRLSCKIFSGNSGVNYRSKVLTPARWSVGGYQYEIAAERLASMNGALFEEGGHRKALAKPGGDYLANPGEKVNWSPEGQRTVVGRLGASAPFHSGDWNELTIICQGNRLIHQLNGVTTIELTDDDSTAKAKSGVLALQLHKGLVAKVQFKNIYLKRLAVAKEAGAAAPPTTPAAIVPATQAASAASATLWIDKTGRTLTAKFVRVEDANVVLDISGKTTPVALASLSTASQQIARDLQTASATKPASADDGFNDLFSPAELGQWKSCGQGGMTFENGIGTTWMPAGSKGFGVFWYGKRTFSDFVLKTEFRAVQPEFNSGLRLRFPNPGNDPVSISTSGYEIAIKDPSPVDDPTGSIYKQQRPSASPLKPLGEWNEMEVAVTGQSYTVTLNGQVVNRFTGTRLLEGYIGLENHVRGAVQFRNVRIKELKASATR